MRGFRFSFAAVCLASTLCSGAFAQENMIQIAPPKTSTSETVGGSGTPTVLPLKIVKVAGAKPLAKAGESVKYDVWIENPGDVPSVCNIKVEGQVTLANGSMTTQWTVKPGTYGVSITVKVNASATPSDVFMTVINQRALALKIVK